MKCLQCHALFFGTIFFVHLAFAGCGQSDMTRAVGQLMSEARTIYKVPGVQISMICPGNKTPYDFVSGYANVQDAIPMRQNHLFQVGSETKSFIAAVILQLEGEGKLSIHDSIGRYLANLPLSWQSVTIEQLLNHTSGLPDYLASPELLNTIKATEGTKQWTAEEMIQLVRETAPNFQPGTGWNYSQTNYILAGKLIEVITQNTLEDELKSRIFEPLHLENTVYTPYAYSEEILQRMAHGYSEYGLFPNEPKDITNYNMSWLGSAAAMLSTAHDKAIWLKALLTADILPPLQKQSLKHLVDIENGQFLPLSSSKYGYGAGIVGWYTSPAGPIWGGLGKTLGYYTGTFYLSCNDIVVSTAFNHFGKAEHEGPGVRLFLLKLINTIKSFDKKQCPKVKMVEMADSELVWNVHEITPAF